MTTLTGTSTRTITGYLVTLLEYPRWHIEREVDFSHCHLQGEFDTGDETCRNCHFGEACRWLTRNRLDPTPATPLPELVRALQTAVAYLRPDTDEPHDRHCECDTCHWLREANNFLRIHRHRT